jgi:hypothetical protein
VFRLISMMVIINIVRETGLVFLLSCFLLPR